MTVMMEIMSNMTDASTAKLKHVIQLEDIAIILTINVLQEAMEGQLMILAEATRNAAKDQ